MNAKKFFAAIAVILLASVATVNAQNENRRENRRNAAEMYTRMAERMAKTLDVASEKQELFKAMYVEYQTARAAADKARARAEANRGENGRNRERVDMSKLSEAEAAERVQDYFATQEAQLAIDKEYYAKFQQIVTPVQAARVFLQRGGMMQREGMQRGEGMRGGQRGFGGGQGGFGGGFGGGDF